MTTLTARRLPWPLSALAPATSLEPLKYLAASILALGVDLGSFSLGLRVFGLAWPIAACVGFLLGAATAYWASIRFVFSQRSQREHPGREIAVFVLIGAAGLAVTQAVLWLCIGRLHLHAELSRLLAAGVTFLFNYFTRALVLFRDRAPASLAQ